MNLALNIEKHLILVKNEDKTEQIDYCEYMNGKWVVIYHNNSNKDYNYSYNNVLWYKNPKIINHENSLVFESDQPLSGILKINRFW